LLAVVVAGCGMMTHELQLKGFTANTVAPRLPATARIAVVLSAGDIKPTYSTSTDGHTFIIHQARQFYEQAYRTAFRNVTVETFSVDPPDDFDVYLYPALDLVATGWISHACTARFTLVIKDATGRELGRTATTATGNFVRMAAALDACVNAIRTTFFATYPFMDAQLATVRVRTPPPPPPPPPAVAPPVSPEPTP